MARPGVRFRGLRELDRALGKADKTLRKKLRDGFRDVATDVATTAREIATSKDLRDSGDMIRQIRPFSLSGRAGVRSGATHRGFNYPNRLEYEGRAGGDYGPKASLNPAVEANEPEINRGIETALDSFEADFERNPIR